MASRLPDVPGVPTGLDRAMRDILTSLREHVRALRGTTNVAGLSSTSAGSVGGGGSGDIDPTPPPMPSGVDVSSSFSTVFVSTDPPVFPQGHGYGRTLVYGAKYPGTGPLPTFSSAVVVHEFVGDVGSFSTDLGTQWHIWPVWRSADGFDSAPEGGTNGHQTTTGKVGTSDLGPLIVEAANLASGAVTAGKIAASAIAVGSAAIQDGAIRNALIENLAVDDAKIANLNVSKLRAGSIAVGDYIQSSGYVAGTVGWRISGSGNFEVRNSGSTRVFNLGASGSDAVVRVGSSLEILANGTATFAGALSAATGTFAGSLSAATGTFAGNLSAAGGTFSGALSAASGTFAGSVSGVNGTFGTITAGVLRNSAFTTLINLNATGSADFIYANGGTARITADGDAFFTKTLASGTWTGSIQLIDPFAPDPTPERFFYIDTGYSKPWSQLFERSLTCRLGGFTASFTPVESANDYVGKITVCAVPAIDKPVFQIPVTIGNDNPYGAGNERVWLRVVAQLSDADGKTSFLLTSLQWTLDVSG